MKKRKPFGSALTQIDKDYSEGKMTQDEVDRLRTPIAPSETLAETCGSNVTIGTLGVLMPSVEYGMGEGNMKTGGKGMQSVTEGGVLKEINDAYRKYYGETGRKPTRIYVGELEFIDLKRSTVAYRAFNIGGEPAPIEVMGMQVFEVCENNHFYVC